MRSKKVIGGIAIAAILVSVLVMAGCGGATEITNIDKIPTIGEPTNVKAVVVSDFGVIQITWDPVSDAKSYDVYRRAVMDNKAPVGGTEKVTDWSTYRIPSSGISANSAYDIVGFSNPLKDGYDYEYVVVANSGQSTNRAISQDDVVLNSSAKSAKVTAKVQPQGTALPAPDASLEVAAPFGNETVGNYRAIWTRQPGVSYTLAFTRENSNGVGDITIFDNNVSPTSSLNATLATYSWPQTNTGNELSKVVIRASFANDYYKAVVVAPALPAAPVLKPSYGPVYPSFTASPKGGTLLEPSYVELDWLALADAKGYKVYKAEANSSNQLLTSLVELSGTPVEYYTTSGTIAKKFRLEDKNVGAGIRYAYYMVITGYNDGLYTVSDYVTIAYSASTNDVDAFKAYESPSVGIANQYAHIPADKSSVYRKGELQALDITWDVPNYINGIGNVDPLNMTFVLERAQVTLSDPFVATSEPVSFGTWTTVATVDKNSASFKKNSSYYKVFVVDAAPAETRVNYAYKLTMSTKLGNGDVSAKPKITVTSEAPYVTYTNLEVKLLNNRANYLPANSLVVGIRANDSYYGYKYDGNYVYFSNDYLYDIDGDNRYVTLWRRDTTHIGSDFVMLDGVKISGRAIYDGNTTINANFSETWYNGNNYYEFIDTGAQIPFKAVPVADDPDGIDRHSQYEYKAILMTKEGAQFKNISTSNITNPSDGENTVDNRAGNFSVAGYYLYAESPERGVKDILVYLNEQYLNWGYISDDSIVYNWSIEGYGLTTWSPLKLEREVDEHGRLTNRFVKTVTAPAVLLDQGNILYTTSVRCGTVYDTASDDYNIFATNTVYIDLTPAP